MDGASKRTPRWRRAVTWIGSASDRRRAQDRTTLRRLRQVVPSQSVDWLRDHDFGTAWTKADIGPFQTLSTELYGPRRHRYQFRDPALQACAGALQSTLDLFNESIGLLAIDYDDLPEVFSIADGQLSPFPKGEAARLAEHEETRRALSAERDDLVAAFDALLDQARWNEAVIAP
jgi:hypothetical protein